MITSEVELGLGFWNLELYFFSSAGFANGFSGGFVTTGFSASITNGVFAGTALAETFGVTHTPQKTYTHPMRTCAKIPAASCTRSRTPNPYATIVAIISREPGINPAHASLQLWKT